MEKNKALITTIIIAAYVVITAVHISMYPVGHEAIHVALVIVALGIGWFVGWRGQESGDQENKSITDSLTGLHNYSYFVDRLHEERKRADRFGSRVSMILIEIDGLKKYNDEHGAEQGKELIKHVGEIITIQVRGVDIVSRYSAQQFGALLPNTGSVAAYEVAERVCAAVKESAFAPAGGGGHTVSAGLATYPDVAGDDVQLIERVDEALAQSKAAGHNRVTTFGSDNSGQRAAT